MIGTPLLAPAVNMLPPLSSRPCGLLKVATATWPSVRVWPLLKRR